jgi:hypothetical protein
MKKTVSLPRPSDRRKRGVASHRTAAERVLEFLELPFPPALEIPPPAVEKQANQISREWAACYLKLKGAKTGRLARVLRRMRA